MFRTRAAIVADLARVAWKPQAPAESLDEAYRLTLELGESERSWYHRRIGYRRWMSWIIRGLAVAALLFAAVVPIVNSANDAADLGWRFAFAQYATVALVLAGFLLLADRLFLITAGWSRFMLTSLEIDAHLIELRYAWLRARIAWKDGVPTQPQALSALEALQATQKKVQESVKDETEAWAQETAEAMETLRKQIDQSRKTLDATREKLAKRIADEDAAAQHGRIQVSVEGIPEGRTPELVVESENGDAKRKRVSRISHTPTFEKLAPGWYTVRLVVDPGDPEGITENVKVEPDAVGKAKLAYPSA